MEFFSYEYDPNVMFNMYEPMHVLMLGIVAVLFVLFFLFKHKLAESPHETTILRSTGVFLVIMLITLAIIETSAGHVYLPFHLCAISYILTIIMLFNQNETIFKYVFFIGIIGGIVTFAIPDLYHAGYNRFRFYEFIIAHCMIIMVPLYFFTEKGYKITLKHTLVAILITNILGFIMIPINLFLDSSGIVENANYMFTMGPPADVESVFGTFPLHLLTFEAVLLVCFFLTYYFAKVYQDKKKAA
jgi:hypothetical integral membrane protein (TIGR02206 family)